MNLKGRREQKTEPTAQLRSSKRAKKVQEKKTVQNKVSSLKSKTRRTLRTGLEEKTTSEESHSFLTANLKESELNNDDLDIKMSELEEEFKRTQPQQPNFFQIEQTMAQGERLFNLLTESEDKLSKFIKPLLFNNETEVSYDQIYQNEDRLHIWECYYGKEYSEYLTAGHCEDDARQSNSQRLTTPVKCKIVSELEAMDGDKIDINMLLSTAAKVDSESKDRKKAACAMGSQIYRGCVCRRRIPKMVCSAIFARHPDLGWNIRIMVVDWMKEFAANFKVKRSTYHLSVAILDAYLQASEDIGKNKIQLVAAICLILASKYDDSILNLSDMSFLSSKPSTMSDAKSLEFDICKVSLVSQGLKLETRTAKLSFSNNEHHALLG